MKRRPVDSSAVASVGYDPKTHTLEIEFIEGRIYQYHNVPQGFFRALLNAESIGTFVNQVIKPRFPLYEEI